MGEDTNTILPFDMEKEKRLEGWVKLRTFTVQCWERNAHGQWENLDRFRELNGSDWNHILCWFFIHDKSNARNWQIRLAFSIIFEGPKWFSFPVDNFSQSKPLMDHVEEFCDRKLFSLRNDFSAIQEKTTWTSETRRKETTVDFTDVGNCRVDVQWKVRKGKFQGEWK